MLQELTAAFLALACAVVWGLVALMFAGCGTPTYDHTRPALTWTWGDRLATQDAYAEEIAPSAYAACRERGECQ